MRKHVPINRGIVLLSDGENENSGGYADAVRRRRSRREFVPDLQAENFLGCNRVVTRPERAHYTWKAVYGLLHCWLFC